MPLMPQAFRSDSHTANCTTAYGPNRAHCMPNPRKNPTGPCLRIMSAAAPSMPPPPGAFPLMMMVCMFVAGDVVTVMARPVTTDAANTSSGPSFQPLFRNSVFTTSYVAILVAPSTAARATVVPRPLYRPSTPSLAITSRPTWNMDGGGNCLEAAIWIMSRSVGEAMAAAPAPATRPAVIFFHTGSSSAPPLVSSATFKGSYKPKRSELYVASRNAAAENPRYKPLSPSLRQMEAVCANIPSGTSPRMPASCCCTIAVLVQCTVPCATTQLVPTNPKFSPI
mmetsp:Transcript_9787/g.41106  ORF Transcript_9787/g.41106 Transcript_9787/m.41106 type:complete len:281 (+) Transcript_9787:93-935(+)